MAAILHRDPAGRRVARVRHAERGAGAGDRRHRASSPSPSAQAAAQAAVSAASRGRRASRPRPAAGRRRASSSGRRAGSRSAAAQSVAAAQRSPPNADEAGRPRRSPGRRSPGAPIRAAMVSASAWSAAARSMPAGGGLDESQVGEGIGGLEPVAELAGRGERPPELTPRALQVAGVEEDQREVVADDRDPLAIAEPLARGDRLEEHRLRAGVVAARRGRRGRGCRATPTRRLSSPSRRRIARLSSNISAGLGRPAAELEDRRRACSARRRPPASSPSARRISRPCRQRSLARLEVAGVQPDQRQLVERRGRVGPLAELEPDRECLLEQDVFARPKSLCQLASIPAPWRARARSLVGSGGPRRSAASSQMRPSASRPRDRQYSLRAPVSRRRKRPSWAVRARSSAASTSSWTMSSWSRRSSRVLTSSSACDSSHRARRSFARAQLAAVASPLASSRRSGVLADQRRQLVLADLAAARVVGPGGRVLARVVGPSADQPGRREPFESGRDVGRQRREAVGDRPSPNVRTWRARNGTPKTAIRR